MRGREKFRIVKPVLMIGVKILNFFPKKYTKNMFKMTQNVRGYKGIALRWIFLKSCAKKCGDNVVVMPQVYFFDIDKIEFGNNISIHPMCYIDGEGGIKIGNGCAIAHRVTILSSEHNYENSAYEIKEQGMKTSFVDIEDDVWIGASSIIIGKKNRMKIGKGSVIGAGSIVVHKIEPYVVVGGNPAKFIKKREFAESTL